MISKINRWLVFAIDNFKCIYCGRRSGAVELEVEHLTPKAKGGSDDLENLVSACVQCNNRKLTQILSAAARKEIQDRRRPMIEDMVIKNSIKKYLHQLKKEKAKSKPKELSQYKPLDKTHWQEKQISDMLEKYYRSGELDIRVSRAQLGKIYYFLFEDKNIQLTWKPKRIMKYFQNTEPDSEITRECVVDIYRALFQKINNEVLNARNDYIVWAKRTGVDPLNILFRQGL